MKQADHNTSVRQLSRHGKKPRRAGTLVTGTVTAMWLVLQGTFGSLPGLAQSQTAEREALTYSELLKKLTPVRSIGLSWIQPVVWPRYNSRANRSRMPLRK